MFQGVGNVGEYTYVSHLPAHRYHLAHPSPGHRSHRETSELLVLLRLGRKDGIQRIAAPRLRRLTSPATHDREHGIPPFLNSAAPSPP